MAISPMLVIGCGGSGGKVVLGLRRRLEEDLRRRGWNDGIPDAWQLKWVDVPTVQEHHPEFGPTLPREDYVALAPVDQYRLIDASLVAGSAEQRIERLIGWRPTPSHGLPVSKGAGQMRAVGRAVALANSKVIADAIKGSLDKVAGARAELGRLGRTLGGDGEVDESPVVFVVSSLAGGTGAGIFIDICDVVRGVRPELSNRIFGMLFSAEIFRGIGGNDAGMAPNTVAAVGELMSGFLSEERAVEPLFGTIGGVAGSGKSGPSWPYVIGMQPLGGGEPLQTPAQCYRAVTETILATMLDETFQQDFIGYQVTNFAPNAGPANRQTAFEMLNEPRSFGDPTVPCGVVSSFGSATVSVGAGRFGQWARDRLSRAVVDHMVSGWRDHGRQLMGDRASAATTDQDVVDFLVARDRQRFIDRCGLWEENEPDGTEHNQVLEGITRLHDLAATSAGFRSRLTSELGAIRSAGASEWQSHIEGLVEARRGSFAGDVEKQLVEGVETYAPRLVGRIEAAVSESLSQFGVPVTRGLVTALRDQCRNAIDQLESEAVSHGNNARQSTSQWIAGAFQQLGNGKTAADSEYVQTALRQALGPAGHAAVQRRAELAATLIDRIVQRVLNPLLAQLDEVAALLGGDEFTQRVRSWPDDSGDVDAVYRPGPSEFVLVGPDEWNTEYHRLVGESAGSVVAARNLVAAGGFDHGPVIDRRTAPLMVSFDDTHRWWDPDAGFVDITLRLRPDEIVERARLWLWDDNHALGKFLGQGLGEHLAASGPLRHQRVARFEDALVGARQLAEPLVGIDRGLMQRMHPGHDSLDRKVTCEQFPFEPDAEEARKVVERVMFGTTPPDGGWFRPGNTAGIETVLITSVLDNPVQPAVITSLTEPIAAAWDAVRTQPADRRQSAVRGFWSYNRARLLTESIPLTQPTIQQIVRGWFVGRLLGVVTSATANEPFTVQHEVDGRLRSARLPWPLLRHRDVPELHARPYQAEWLPAILEHLALAMMMFGHDPSSLDGYEQLFRLGERADSLLADWVSEGCTPTGSTDGVQLRGSTEAERKDNLLESLTTLRDVFAKRRDQTIVSKDWETFVTIPFGYELLPLIVDELDTLRADSNALEGDLGLG